MRIIEMNIEVSRHGEVILQLPPDIPAGEHRAVIVIEENLIEGSSRPPLNFPVDDYGVWPNQISLKRKGERS